MAIDRKRKKPATMLSGEGFRYVGRQLMLDPLEVERDIGPRATVRMTDDLQLRSRPNLPVQDAIDAVIKTLRANPDIHKKLKGKK